jgi:phosphoribosyl 1,2-cyclic phosphodiesterase
MPPRKPTTSANIPDYTFEVKFWGVKDKIATPGQNSITYGGNTSCVEVKTTTKRLIFDGGTGLRELGNEMLGEMPVKAHIFFSHFDWDRIQGFPFFVPSFIPGNKFHIYGTQTKNGTSLKEHLYQQMTGPNFPVPIEVMRAKLYFTEIIPGKNYLSKGIQVKALILNSKYNSLGYRVSYQEKSVVYATERENDNHDYQKNLIKLAQNTNLLILPLIADNWQKTLELAKLAQVEKIALTAHHPDYQDHILDKIKTELTSINSQAFIAQEGMTIFI